MIDYAADVTINIEHTPRAMHVNALHLARLKIHRELIPISFQGTNGIFT